jgi:hypothetical protein
VCHALSIETPHAWLVGCNDGINLQLIVSFSTNASVACTIRGHSILNRDSSLGGAGPSTRIVTMTSYVSGPLISNDDRLTGNTRCYTKSLHPVEASAATGCSPIQNDDGQCTDGTIAAKRVLVCKNLVKGGFDSVLSIEIYIQVWADCMSTHDVTAGCGAAALDTRHRCHFFYICKTILRPTRSPSYSFAFN